MPARVSPWSVRRHNGLWMGPQPSHVIGRRPAAERMDAGRVAALRGVVDQLAACEEALQGCVDDIHHQLGAQGKFVAVTAQTHVILALAKALGKVRLRCCLPYRAFF